MGFFKTISNAVFKEYDRRIKRASLITEYGAAQHSDHGVEHEDDVHEHEDDAEEEEGAEEAEIVNVPRGTPVVASEPAPEAPQATH